MTNHEEIKALIQKKLDQSLTAVEDMQLKEHLAICSDCQQFSQEMESITAWIFGLIEFYPSPSFNLRVMTKLGYHRSTAWARVMAICGFAWLMSVVTMIFTPYPKMLFGKILASMPAMIRFAEHCRVVMDALAHLLTPLARIGINPLYITIAAFSSLLLLVFLGKTLSIKKENTCQVS